jgi:hypothetical protein
VRHRNTYIGTPTLEHLHRNTNIGTPTQRSGFIISFNRYISLVKRIHNEERGTSPRFVFLKFFCYAVFVKQKKKLSNLYY